MAMGGRGSNVASEFDELTVDEGKPSDGDTMPGAVVAEPSAAVAVGSKDDLLKEEDLEGSAESSCLRSSTCTDMVGAGERSKRIISSCRTTFSTDDSRPTRSPGTAAASAGVLGIPNISRAPRSKYMKADDVVDRPPLLQHHRRPRGRDM